MCEKNVCFFLIYIYIYVYFFCGESGETPCMLTGSMFTRFAQSGERWGKWGKKVGKKWGKYKNI